MLGVLLFYEYYQCLMKGGKTALSTRLQWRRLLLFMSCWVGAYLFNFILNMLFPAVSPRIHMDGQFTHEIEGIAIAKLIRSGLRRAASDSYSAFPSGHTALSWLAAILAQRFGYPRFARYTRIAATLITIATVILRYHYFVDVLFAPVIILFALFNASLQSPESFEEALRYEDGTGKREAEISLSERQA